MNINIKNLINFFCNKCRKDLEESNKNLLEEIDELKIEMSSLGKENLLCVDDLTDYVEEVERLNKVKDNYLKQLENKQEEIGLEKFWNNKRPKINITYPGRPLFSDKGKFLGQCKVDPRVFFSNDLLQMPKLRTKKHDNTAIQSLNWVAKNIKYKSESKEYWQFAYETLMKKAGDCEDGAILLANMMIANGIPYWRIRINAGDVKGGGHAYVTYLAEKDNSWKVLDWCYWYNESKNLNKDWKDANKYYSDEDKQFGIWFSFNKKYCYDNLEKVK